MKQTRGGPQRRRLTFVGGAVVVTAASVGSGCSSKHDAAPGAIMVAVDTNLKVSGDLDAIGISVTSADGSKITEDQTWSIAPTGAAKFPATLAVVRGTSQPVKIRVVGFQGGNPITLREAVTTIPADHTALLRMDIDWLDEGTAGVPATAAAQAPATGPEVSSLASLLCPAGQTSIGGTCSSFTLDSAALGQFAPEADTVPSDGPECFDVAGCFAGTKNAGDEVTTVATPAPGDCSLPVPAAAAGKTVNIGLNVKPGHGGWCSASGCVVPIENDRNEGWSITKAGRLQLPAGACTNPAVESIAVLVGGCDSYTPGHPACESYGGDGGAPSDATVPPPGMDATIDAPSDAEPDADGATADAMEASIPDGPFTYAPPSTATYLDFAVTASRVYVVVNSEEAGGVSLQVFPRGAPALASAVVPLAGYVAQRQPPRTAASGSTLVIASGNPQNILETLTVGEDASQVDAGAFAVAGRLFGNVGVQALPGGSLRVYVGGASDDYFCWHDLGGGGACTGGGDPLVEVAAANPADQMYALAGEVMSASGAFLPELLYAPLNAAAVDGGAFAGYRVLTALSASAEALAFANGSTLAWLDEDGNVFLVPTAGGSVTNVTDGAVTTATSLGAGADTLAWIVQGGDIRSTSLDAGQLSAVRGIADAGALKVVIDGADLFWSDGTNVHSVPLSTVALAPVVPKP